jgi:hypothetical protein
MIVLGCLTPLVRPLTSRSLREVQLQIQLRAITDSKCAPGLKLTDTSLQSKAGRVRRTANPDLCAYSEEVGEERYAKDTPDGRRAFAHFGYLESVIEAERCHDPLNDPAPDAPFGDRIFDLTYIQKQEHRVNSRTLDSLHNKLGSSSLASTECLLFRS